MGQVITEAGQAIIDQVSADWSSHQIRDLAASLTRLADSIDQNWHGSNTRSIFRWPSALHRIEKNAVNLAWQAKLIAAKRNRRSEFISPELLGEPAWDMLLELFMQFAGGAKVSVTSLCIASKVPATTALRYVSLLEQHGLARRTESRTDRRVSFVELTDAGILAVGRYLESI